MRTLVDDVAIGLAVAACAATLIMAAWPRGSRRFGALICLAALAATVLGTIGDSWSLWIWCWSGAVVAFWLVDRGIPGNRPRPRWLRIAAVVLSVLSVLVGALALAGQL